MDVAGLIGAGVTAVFAIIMGIKKIRKWNIENKRTVIADDNERGAAAVKRRVLERLGRKDGGQADG